MTNAIQKTQQFSLTPTSIDEALRLADMLAKASLVPKDYQGNPANCLIAMQWGMEIGLQPLQAMQNIAVINGRPSIWGDAMIALVRGSGLLESIQETIDGETMVAECTVTRKGEQPVSREFSLEDAKRAGLAGKQGPWQQYPKRMLQMRARAWALRDVFPDVLRGVAMAEEAMDKPAERDMGPAEVIDRQPQAATRAEEVKAKIAAKTKAKAAKQEPARGDVLESVINTIQGASTLDELALAAEAGKDLSGSDLDQAREAYAARRRELSAD